MSLRSTSAALAWALAAALNAPTSTHAQGIGTVANGDNTVAIEILKPNFDGDDGTKFLTSAWFLSSRWRVSPSLRIVGELPFAYASVKDPFLGGSESAAAVGNPYVGIEVGSRDSRVSFDFGVRAPLADEDQDIALATGLAADLDRWEAFLPEVLPITGIVSYRYRDPSGFGIRFRGGPALWLNVGESDADPELFALYSGQVMYENRRVSLAGGLSGRAIVTEGDLDFGQRTIHQLGLGAAVALGQVRPGIQLLVPVDDEWSDLVDYSVGLTLSVTVP